MLPLVTVIIPAYNCGKYIEQAIKSVLGQDYDNVQLVVIDDCSTDDTLARIKPFINNNKLSYYRHIKNQGEQVTVNEGLKLVKGKYFIILNSDDLLTYSSIKSLVNFMEANSDVLCGYPDWNSINEDGSFKSHIKVREYDFSWMVRHHTWLMSVGSIFRSDVIKLVGYRDTSFKWLGDADYWLRVGLAGPMARVPSTLACWRNRNGQASKDKSDLRAQEHIKVMQKFFSKRVLAINYKNNIIYSTDWETESMAWSYIVAASVTDSKIKSINYLLQAVKTYPKLMISFEFYSVLIERAKHILRR